MRMSSLRVRLLVPVLAAVAPGFALILYAVYSERALLRIFGRTLGWYVAISVVAVSIALVAGQVLLVKRLRAVISAARRLSRGDHAARTGLLPSRDELGDLTRAFDDMAAAIGVLSRENRLILDSAGDGILRLSSGGQVTYANPAAGRLLHRTTEELAGSDAHDVLHAGRHDTAAAREACSFATLLRAVDHVSAGSDEFHGSDGAAFPVEYVVSPVQDRGELAGALVSFKDVTERRRLEEQLGQAHKMEAVGRLAGGIAHDFNNLLSVILTAGCFARDALTADDPARADVEEILVAARRAGALTRQLLAFSRRQLIEPRVFDLSQAVLETEKMLRRVIGEHVSLETLLAPGRCWIRADPGQIEQLVVNLAVNARDAMPAGGRLSLGVERSDLSEATPQAEHAPGGPHVVLSVGDTGVGMDKETVSRIFEPFFTTKPVGKGTGLGLSTVYGIVQHAGGVVRVTSAPGKGTTFRVYFPRAPAPGLAIVDTRDSAPRGSESVLLVEDEDALRDLAARTLASAGYRVVKAAGASAARTCVEAHGGAIDLLLTDIILPEMNGIDLAKALTERVPNLRVLYMSGYAGEPHGARELSGRQIVQKPFSPEDLLQRVRCALDGHAPAGLLGPA